MSSLRKNFTNGFSLVEVILSMSLMLIIALGVSSSIVFAQDSIVRFHNRTQAVAYAEEGIEAVRNIRDESFSNIADGTYGLGITSNKWSLNGSSDTNGIYTRSISITTLSTGIKRVSTTVNWEGKSYTMTADLTDWRAITITTYRTGMLVFGSGGTTSDIIKYQLLNSNMTWSASQNTADVDTTTTNKAAVGTRLYSSKIRNEKILLSKHCDGVSVYFYAQVWNGTTWGNVTLLGSYLNALCANSQSKDISGTYLNNGNFMTVYNDNSNIPKYRIWNAATWGSQQSATSIGASSRWLTVRARPGTNEAMLISYDNSTNTKSQYYNGTSWSSVTTLRTGGSATFGQITDFAWSPVAPTKGNVTYPAGNNDKKASARIWTANGSGSGSWGALVNGDNLSQKINATTITARPTGSAEFIQCRVNGQNPGASTLDLSCSRSDTTPTFTTPTNNLIGSGIDGVGVQKDYDFDYSQLGGLKGLVAWGDETSTPKVKKYDATTNSFDLNPTSLTSIGAIAKSFKTIGDPKSNDIIILIGDANSNVYTQVWDGTNDMAYTTSGLAMTSHSASGYNYQNYYFDFAWDN